MLDIKEIEIPLEGARFVRCDLNFPLELEDESFDLIISLETIEHLYNPNQYMAELNRMLKKNGLLILSTPNIHNIFSRILFLLTGKLHWYRDWMTRDLGGHVTPIYKKAFQLMYQRNGFGIVDHFTTIRGYF